MNTFLPSGPAARSLPLLGVNAAGAPATNDEEGRQQ